MDLTIRREGYEPQKPIRMGFVPTLIAQAKANPGRWVAAPYEVWDSIRTWAWQINSTEKGKWAEPGLQAFANKEEMKLEICYVAGEPAEGEGS